MKRISTIAEFRRVMALRRAATEAGERAWLTKAARKLAWLAKGVPVMEGTE